MTSQADILPASLSWASHYKHTTIEDWQRSDEYHNSFLVTQDPAAAAKEGRQSDGLPDIAVSTAEAKFLALIALSIRAERILEVGTLGGYSTIWFAKSVPENGKVVTLELFDKFADVAQANFEKAGVADKIELVRGPAAQSLKAMQVGPGRPPFDLIFIDADKEGNKDYFIEAKRLLRKGGVIIVDNVVRQGDVADPKQNDSMVKGVRTLLKYIKEDKEVSATTMSMVGEKGYDGILYAVKL